VHFAEAARLGMEHELERATLAGRDSGGARPPRRFSGAQTFHPIRACSPELPALLAGTDRAVVLEITEHAQVGD